jgi:hypothetical protein
MRALGARRADVAQGPSVKDLSRLVADLGYNLMTATDGTPVAVPKDMPSDEFHTLGNKWSSIETSSADLVNNRQTRMATYRKMDRSGGESAVVLDTLADEVVNITDYTESSLVIKISDSALERQVMEVLQSNNVLQNIRSDIRSLCKFGDFAYVLSRNDRSKLIDIDERKAGEGSVIQVPFKPGDIAMHFAHPDIYELEHSATRTYKLLVGPGADSVLGFALADKEFYPWEYCVYCIGSRDTYPYGLSELEKMRVPWEKLAILEELLAITRQSRLDRIAITIPGLKGDPASVLNRLNFLKNSIKSIVLGFAGPGQRVTRNQDTGMTEYLWIPEGFDAKKLSTSIEISTIEDVEYFRDKLINASRLPKGFFLASENQGNQRPMSLRQQDIKFARSLIPIGEAYCAGLKKLVTLCVFYLGGDVSKVRVDVAFKKSPYITSELMQTYKDTYDIISTFKEIKTSFTSTKTITDQDIKRILDLIGVPHTIFFPEDDGARRKLDEVALLAGRISPDHSSGQVVPYRSLLEAARADVPEYPRDPAR